MTLAGLRSCDRVWPSKSKHLRCGPVQKNFGDPWFPDGPKNILKIATHSEKKVRETFWAVAAWAEWPLNLLRWVLWRGKHAYKWLSAGLSNKVNETGMGLKGMMLIDAAIPKKFTYWIFPLTWHSWDDKIRQMENRLSGSQALGMGEGGDRYDYKGWHEGSRYWWNFQYLDCGGDYMNLHMWHTYTHTQNECTRNWWNQNRFSGLYQRQLPRCDIILQKCRMLPLGEMGYKEYPYYFL